MRLHDKNGLTNIQHLHLSWPKCLISQWEQLFHGAPGESGPNANESMFSIIPCILFFISAHHLPFPSRYWCGRRAGKTDGEAKDDGQTEGGGREVENAADSSGETICGLLETGKGGDEV